ncbi:MAG: TonB-dependent receptor [Bacteroidia bacterium]|nr:TonB-dependent receptor [Bacteroidia bacterium]
MKKRKYLFAGAVMLTCIFSALQAQVTIRGEVIDAAYNDPIIGANIIFEGTTEGTISDWDGTFEITTNLEFPVNIVVSYIGFADQVITVVDDKKIKVLMVEDSEVLEEIVVKGSRISEENKKSPLTVESIDVLAVRESPTSNFYEGLGALKGVDMTTASLGFQVINTRGFNSTSPVRSLQIIDGVDNQAPGLNFSLGNFLGSSELDVLKVDIIVGASSAFYGPNAFNGVISMETKNPFFQKGLAAYVKGGERGMKEFGFRYADALANDNGNDWLAYKLNFSYLDADDWEADNKNPVFDTETGVDNPGRYDAVNTYGDEYQSIFDQSSGSPWSPDIKGLGVYHRQGYEEQDLLTYKTKNLKSNASIHFRLQPDKTFESPELILSSSFSNGTTIYQGENRFALKDILFFQNRIEFRKQDKYFLRAYMTKDDAGDTYDPYFTALLLQKASKSNQDWNGAYINHWKRNIIPRIDASGYPQLEIEVDQMGNVNVLFDYDALDTWNMQYQDSLRVWHSETAQVANIVDSANENFTNNFYEPGTERFNEEFQRITSTPSGQGGSRIIDRSALYHLHGEYKFEPQALNYLKVGANARLYKPESEGTIFIDSTGVSISNFEYGVYGGLEKKLHDNVTFSATVRVDKNQNFNHLVSPAGSFVFTPGENNFLRLSFSSAIRNPTLSDQYLDFNVGPAILRGNLNGVDSLVEIESFIDYIDSLFIQDRPDLNYFNIDPIRPEKVKTFEIGYRTTLFEKLYVDAGYYYSIYNDFIGYNLGLDLALDNGFPTGVQAYRYSANSKESVTTQGVSIGLNYFIGSFFKVATNYSWNKLNTDVDDNIIPAFNTPEHKYNIGFSGRDIPLGGNKFGFNINYKWIQGFIFEGSPQFTGPIEDYGLLDAQVNYKLEDLNTTIKIGASNLLNNEVYQTYGGPLVGRLAYATILYDFQKK